jgi:hypothetical protein
MRIGETANQCDKDNSTAFSDILKVSIKDEMHFINMRIYLRVCSYLSEWWHANTQGFFIFTHVGKVRLRKALKCANYFHPRWILSLPQNSSARAFWLHSGEQRESLFVSLTARLSAQGALDIWDGKLKVALMKKAACVLETAAQPGSHPRGVSASAMTKNVNSLASLVMIFWRFKRSPSSLQMQNFSRSWSLRARLQRGLFVYHFHLHN